jgi:hypothetical protein
MPLFTQKVPAFVNIGVQQNLYRHTRLAYLVAALPFTMVLILANVGCSSHAQRMRDSCQIIFHSTKDASSKLQEAWDYLNRSYPLEASDPRKLCASFGIRSR